MYRSSHLPIVRGDRRNPHSEAVIIAKFHANTTVLGQARAYRIVSMVMALSLEGSPEAVVAELRSPVLA